MKIKTETKKMKRHDTKLNLAAFTLALCLSGIANGARAESGGTDIGSGGQVIDVDGRPELRDLVDNTVCDWELSSSFMERLEYFPVILDSLRPVHFYLALNLPREAAILKICKTGGGLKQLPADDLDGVTVVEAEGRQAAIRIADRVYLDMSIFERMSPEGRAYLFVHEVAHTYIPLDTKQRNSKVRSFVATIHRNEKQTLTSRNFALQLEMNSVEIMSPRELDRFLPVRAELEAVLGSEDTEYTDELGRAMVEATWIAESYKKSDFRPIDKKRIDSFASLYYQMIGAVSRRLEDGDPEAIDEALRVLEVEERFRESGRPILPLETLRKIMVASIKSNSADAPPIFRKWKLLVDTPLYRKAVSLIPPWWDDKRAVHSELHKLVENNDVPELGILDEVLDYLNVMGGLEFRMALPVCAALRDRKYDALERMVAHPVARLSDLDKCYDESTKREKSAIFLAAEKIDLRALRILLGKKGAAKEFLTQFNWVRVDRVPPGLYPEYIRNRHGSGFEIQMFPLQWAVIRGGREMVRLLLSQSGTYLNLHDVKEKDHFVTHSWTTGYDKRKTWTREFFNIDDRWKTDRFWTIYENPLCLALRHGMRSIAMMLASDARISETSALSACSMRLVESESGSGLFRSKTKKVWLEAWSPLAWAIAQGDREMVNQLVKNAEIRPDAEIAARMSPADLESFDSSKHRVSLTVEEFARAFKRESWIRRSAAR